MSAPTRPVIPRLHTPLRLQTVAGIEAGAIGRAVAVPGVTMAQRLVRAKGKIADARIRFRMPDRSDWPARMTTVLAAIYDAVSLGWQDAALGPDAVRGKAIYLAGARLCGGILVLLPEPGPRLWDKTLTDGAILLLSEVSAAGRPGRFQLEAAIQSVHAGRASTRQTDWMARYSCITGCCCLRPRGGSPSAMPPPWPKWRALPKGWRRWTRSARI